MTKPKVTIVCTTFNHGAFIKDALEGFVTQKTNFPFEVIVHDDVSTDNTVEIIKEYEEKYPDIIKPIYQTEKQWGKPFFDTEIYPKIKGEYVVINEGDDYFCHPLKLQKQVDFLDSHPDYSICFHPVKVTFTDHSKADFPYPATKDTSLFTLKNLLRKNYMQTNSVMYRWRFGEHDPIQPYGYYTVVPADWYLHILHAQKGKIGFLPDIMSIYRRHENGMFAESIDNPHQIHLKYGLGEINFYLKLEQFVPEYNELFGHEETCKYAAFIFNVFLQNNKIAETKQVLEMCPECVKYIKF